MGLYTSIAIYGETGVGKTVAALKALNPRVCYWLELEQGALDVAEPPYDNEINPWKVSPRGLKRARECLSIENAPEQLERAVQFVVGLIRKGRVKFVVMDGTSSYSKRYYDFLMGYATQENYAQESRLVVRSVRQAVMAFQAAGAGVVALCHERPPSDLSGLKGGVDLPGKASRDFLALFSGVFRMSWDTDENGHPTPVIWVDPSDSDWYTKDRWRIVQGTVPATRLRGYFLETYRRKSR